jgi:hypothetical protein
MPEQKKPDPLEGLPHDKLRAVLQTLQAEKEKRRDARIAAGKLIVLSLTMVAGKSVERDALEAAKAEVLAKHLAEHPEDKGKAVEWDVLCILTGVERAKTFGNGMGEMGFISLRPNLPPLRASRPVHRRSSS